MSQLYDARKKIEKIIERKRLDPIKTKGAISLRVGFVVSVINAGTPDDPTKLEKLKKAAKEVLGESI